MIRARSPYIVHVDDSGLEDIEFKLYVYSGTSSTDKATGDLYEFAIDAVNGEVTFDVSPYIRQSLGDKSPTTLTRWKWVTMEIDKDTGAGLSGSFSSYEATDIATLGWTLPEDGVNETGFGGVLSASDSVSGTEGDILKPFEAEGAMTVYAYPGSGGQEWEVIFYPEYGQSGTEISATVTSGTAAESDDKYALVTIPSNAKSYKYWREDGLAGEFVGNIYDVGDCKNDPVKIDFINKFGALDTVWFTGRAVEGYSTTESTYRKNMLSSGTYSDWERQNTVFNKMGKRTLKLNSGLYPERFNFVFKELLFAEEIWILDGSRYPLTLKNSSFDYKYGLYEKLINYEMEFEYSNDAINSIK